MKTSTNSLYIILIFCFFSCSANHQDTSSEFHVLFDGESEINNQISISATGDGIIKNTDAYSGKSVFKVSSHNKHLEIGVDHSPTAGSTYQFKVFRKKSNSKAFLRVSTENDFLMYFPVGKQCKNANWEEIMGGFTIPKNSDFHKLHFTLVWDSGEEPVFFDNLEIVKSINQTIPRIDNIEKIELTIDSSAFSKLNTIRDEALKEKVLITTNDSWVKGNMKIGSEKFKIKLRLKGDWTDHLRGTKWSFRIKILKGEKWNNQTTFSIQAPGTRSYSNEWLVHKIMKNENVLTTNYQFNPVVLNGTPLGLFAVEEHPNESFLKHRDLDGFIFKYSDEVLWRTRAKSNRFKNQYYDDKFFLISKIKTHTKKNKKKNSKKYKKAFQAIEDFKNLKGIDHVDKDKFAKFLALCDHTGAYHSMIWHNIKLFYNLKTKKIEPISYDCYTDHGAMVLDRDTIYGLEKKDNVRLHSQEGSVYRILFNDSILYSKYKGYLKYYSENEVVKKNTKQYQPELKKQLILFTKEERLKSSSIPILEVFPKIVSRYLKEDYKITQYIFKPSSNFDKYENEPSVQDDFIKFKIINDSISIINYNPKPVVISNLKSKKRKYKFIKTEIPSYKYFIDNPAIKIALIK
tara:strand:- start:1106 stop:2992 length:1887 start_codon:yes stop_codon:yes gene_type:complete